MPAPKVYPVPTKTNADWMRWIGVVGSLGGVLLFAAGIVVGARLSTGMKLPPAQSPARATSTESGDTTSTPGAADTKRFEFKFTPDETLKYHLFATVAGTGVEMMSPSGIDMQLRSLLNLHTDSVDAQGAGKLTLAFDQTSFQGNFMESPFAMSTGASGSRVQSGGRTVIDTQQGVGSAEGIPQLEFFKTPIRIKVAKNGEVTSVSGPKGMGDMLGSLPAYSELSFPSSTLQDGAEWTSEFAMPIPGFGVAAKAVMHNVFQGYSDYQGKLCGVIHQEITSSQQEGTLDSPESALGDAMGFSMPNFELSGENIVYFDVDNGRLVYSDMALTVKLDIGKALGGAGKLMEGVLSQFGGIIGKDLPEFEGFGQKKDGQGNLLDLDLDITATMTLL